MNKLTLEVWTNSTIDAQDAVSLGARILVRPLYALHRSLETMGNKSTVVERRRHERDKVLELTIGGLDLLRAFLRLPQARQASKHGGDLISKTEDEMMKVRATWDLQIPGRGHNVADGLFLAIDELNN